MTDNANHHPRKISRVLLCNDDGMDAMGLQVLEAIAGEIADEVWVIAPAGNCSGYGRSVTLRQEIKVTAHGTRRYTCDGTPTDCIIFALNHLMKNAPPALVLSGVNLGMNIADDVTCSGTIAAAWQAAVQQIPAIALSQKYADAQSRDLPGVFDAARAHGLAVTRALLRRPWPQHVFMNVNFPSVPAAEVAGIKPVAIDRHVITDDIDMGTGEYTYRINKERGRGEFDTSRDFGALLAGYITISPLSIDMTDGESLKALGGALAGMQI